MSDKMYIEAIGFDLYGKVKVTFNYGDVVISGKLIHKMTRYIDINGHTMDPHSIVDIEGYPFPLILPYRSVRAEVENIIPGETEDNPISFDTVSYKQEYLGKWVKINGIKTGRLIGRVHTEELKEEMNRLEIKDTYVFDDGKTWVCARSGPNGF